MGPPQGRAEGEENLPCPAGHTPRDAPQDPIGLLGSQGTLLAHPRSPCRFPSKAYGITIRELDQPLLIHRPRERLTPEGKVS